MEYEKEKSFKLVFVERTLTIIRDYEEIIRKYKEQKKEIYEVTLLLNCLLALIVLPKNTDYKHIPDERLEQFKAWGIELKHITVVNVPNGSRELAKEDITLRDMVRYMRNAVAHSGCEPKGNGGKITHVEFVSKSPNQRVITCQAVIPVDALKKFATSLANWYIEKLKVRYNKNAGATKNLIGGKE